MTVKAETSNDWLAAGGSFEQAWPGFQARDGQQQMARLVTAAIENKETLVIEAASGSGKTIAYLTPIIAHGQKAIISTATRYLQQQLYRQDIPRVQSLLGSQQRVALLQGRSHYLCPYYLDKNLQSDIALNKQQHSTLANLSHQFRQSGIGDLDKLAPELPASLRGYVTSSRDDCLAKQCPQYSRCPLMIARQKAQQADIVVVNHSVLFADALLRREQLGDLLPSVNAVVVDEAHRVSDFAEGIAGHRLSSGKLKQFLKDAHKAVTDYAPEQRQLLAFIRQLEDGLTRLADHLPSLENYQQRQHRQIVSQLIPAFERVQKSLLPFKDRHQQLKDLLVRSQLLLEKLRHIYQQGDLCVVQGGRHRFNLQSIPANLSEAIQTLLGEMSGSWILTSATLSVAGSPKRFLQSLNLPEEVFRKVDSAINYEQQAVLYTPELAVEPDHPDYAKQLVIQVTALANALEGRVLCLFTSYRSLGEVAKGLQGQLDCPLLVQSTANDQSKADNYRLIETFKKSAKGVLLGTGSFWEGLDLSGVPLAAVVIDKLPFAPPNDPLLQLRSAELEAHGVNSFEHAQLPDAVIRLRQGCGRLLRRITDRGVIMIADPRLHSKSYGEMFIQSLPAMQQFSSLESLKPFLDQPQAETSETE